MQTKICCRCKVEMEVEKFAHHVNSLDGLQAQCRECQKHYRRQHYLKNRQKYLDKSDRIGKAFRQWFKKYKECYSCARCSESHPACIQFHHHNGDKSQNVSTLVASGNKQKVIDEIAKCTPLCANCHAKEHWRERD